jgi:hypothetical protein
VTKDHHKRQVAVFDAAPELLLKEIESFLSRCRRPAALEYGDNLLVLLPGFYALEIRSGRLSVEIWDEMRTVSRRILGIERVATGVLDCTAQKFGGASVRFSFLDLDRPQSAHRKTCGVRQNFAGQFRQMLSRQFPGWEIASLSSSLDLQHSFSSVFPRAKLTRGNQSIAAMASPGAHEEANLLAFALLWYDHVRARARDNEQTSLCLFLGEDAGTLTAHRLRWLAAETLRPRLFRFNAHGSAGEVDPRDLGNLDTRVAARYAPPCLTPDLEALLARLERIQDTAWCPELTGAISIRSRGLEFARIEAGRLLLGLETKSQVRASVTNTCHTEEVANFAVQLAQLRSPVWQQFPERWFESAVRAHLPKIDPALSPAPVHGQVLSFAAGDRGLIDLLAISPGGRLAVLELKTSEDIHLPLQALDYWMRVAWHAQRDELSHLFPGISLQNRAPKLLLIAPALAFHSSTATLLRYFSPEIDVERIGINEDWRKDFRVVLHLKGADLPISHGRHV